ncbi:MULTISPECIES: alpha-L-rhamnosidase C-terminal domain-containing protein [unclassified Dysgonomonas]|uniref:alpha-L-rhamnosidase-related protein n=1 Tax=unclassified Dysgonomonas TaxID=2630389 RepID=UPI0025C30107|nr:MULTISPECIES: alpha-L-rhamnosidase C-terminal domain-containing protein [unclassified Dysgonomonas]
MRIIPSLILAALLLFSDNIPAQQLPLPFQDGTNVKVRSTGLVHNYLTPTRIVWTSDNNSEKYVINTRSILKQGTGQADLNTGTYLRLIGDDTNKGGIILDFGKEIQGGLEIITSINNKNPAGKVRIRFGESVAETMSDIGGEGGATNDHAMRDFIVTLPWLGRLTVGDSGFRFARIDVIDPDMEIEIKEISAVFAYRDIPYLGSFRCNDERLNRIWLTGAYTVHLNMQDYLWDAIKRDRLVWVGDLHPEVMTINTVFGYNDVVPKSLDLARDITPLPAWMNGISSYSMWWIIIHRDWYLYQGNLEYLKEQQEYMSRLLKLLSEKIDKDGKEILDGNRFLDWPSSENPETIHAGLQSMMVMTFEAGEELSRILNDKESEKLCQSTLKKLRKYIPDITSSKQAASLLGLSGLIAPEKANDEVLAQNGVHGMSTFYGYYMLNARAKAGDYKGVLDNIREYWGAMLDLGATTFWEDFDINWMKNAARIDEVVPEGKVNVHASYGGYCYKGYRHSFCHGWASGPTTWLSRYVLGVEPLEAGCKKVRITPNLGDLKWVEGSFPTPYGVIEIKHTKQADGRIESEINAPEGIVVVK